MTTRTRTEIGSSQERVLDRYALLSGWFFSPEQEVLKISLDQLTSNKVVQAQNGHKRLSLLNKNFSQIL